MATHKATLGKTVDGVVEYIYPKSTSDIIEYTETQSVKEKLDELDEKQGVAYGTCSTAASTAAKVVSCDGFVLETGATIVVNFDNANSASSPTMNVNSTGAKSIYAYGTTAPSTNSWRAGGMMAFTYNGSGWVMQDFSTANTSYYGVTKLSDSVSSTSTTLAGTANAVKTAYDAAMAAQDAADAAQTAADAAMSYAEANTYTHPTVTASNTTSTATATYGGTFTAVDSVTRDSCGHVTGVNTKTITMPAETTTATKLGTATVGSGTNPMYLSSGTATASTSTVGSGTKPVYLSSGTITASSSSVGSATTPVYLSSGTITACSGITASTADSATTAETAEKLGSATVGSGTKPIYLSSGTATASSSTVGSGVIPMYLSSGTMTASTSTVGSGTKPIYLSSGTLTVSSSTVGSGTIPMYLSSGTLTASTSTVGSGTKPMYLSSGTLTASSSTVGSSSAPVYLSSGTITACTGVATSSDLSSLSDTVSELSDEISNLETSTTDHVFTTESEYNRLIKTSSSTLYFIKSDAYTNNTTAVDELRKDYLLELCEAITTGITLETYNLDRYIHLSDDVLWNKILDIANDTNATLMDIRYAWNAIEDYVIPFILSSGIRNSSMTTTCQVLYNILINTSFNGSEYYPADSTELINILYNVLQTNGYGDENTVFAQVPTLFKQYLDMVWYSYANSTNPIPTAKIVMDGVTYSQTPYL